MGTYREAGLTGGPVYIGPDIRHAPRLPAPFLAGSGGGGGPRGSLCGSRDGGGAGGGGGSGPAAPRRGPTRPSSGSRPGPSPEPANRGGLSLPGILHFIQHEWARFEAEKGRWEAERAELQAQVAFLQGERKGQENLKTDLVRRIKMLEYALKQERSKYHKLKFGAEVTPGEKKTEGTEPVSNGPTEVTSLGGGPLAWKEGRQLLRQYLEEVGYSDTILDMRSRRVRSLLGRGGTPPPQPPPPTPRPPGPPPQDPSPSWCGASRSRSRGMPGRRRKRGGGGAGGGRGGGPLPRGGGG
ncbi:striatin-4 [Falco cherrug]|uniref:striatin-4 n=1 Tax=Falco cherrug TaxID=345164 RepID=UPI00247A1CA8|nr:striatin-4 [Falco cherrug]